MSNRGLFLDMDNTLIRTKSGKTFPTDINDWEFIPEMVKWLDKVKSIYDVIIIITNQAGIKYGHLTKEDVVMKLQNVRDALVKEISYDEFGTIYYKYSAGYDRFFHKPMPGMAYSAAHFHEIDLSISTMVGDAGGRTNDFSDSDKVFAEKCNMDFIHIQDIINKRV